MRYVLLAYDTPGVWAHRSDDARAAWEAEAAAFVGQLTAQGCVVGGEGLADASTATSVRVREDDVRLSDGPFADTADVLDGFLVIDVPDLDEALEIASRAPAARVGTVEVRPVRSG